MEINSDAPVITRDEILIDAPMEKIWEIQTDVDNWPSWQPDVDGAQAGGPLAVDSVFRWQTAGLDITSTVLEIDAPRRIVWGGTAQGIEAVHVWTLDPREDGVLVRTEESWEGEPVEAQVETLQGALDKSLRATGSRTSSARPKVERLLPDRVLVALLGLEGLAAEARAGEGAQRR